MNELGEAAILVGLIAGLAILPLAGRHGWWPWSAAAITVVLAILYDVLVQLVSGPWFFAGYALFAASPLLVYWLIVRFAEGARPSSFGLSMPGGRVRVIVALALGLDGVYFLLTLEPGVLKGWLLPGIPDPATFGVLLLTTPLLVLGQEALFRGYFLQKVSGRIPFRAALFSSSAMFALLAYNPLLLNEFSLTNQLPTIFLTVGTGFVLGIFAGIFCYKSSWSILGPWLFRTVLLGESLIFPVAVLGLGWETVFVLDLIALTAPIVVLFLAPLERRFEARHYMQEPLQPRRRTLLARARSRKHAIPLVAVLAVALLVVAFAGPISSITSRAPVRILAIETGSMAPTFVRGTLVFLELVSSPSDLHVGDIAAYDAPYLSTSGPVVHRIIGIGYNGSGVEFTFKGDANPSPDPRPVVFSQIVGKVVTYVPYLGYLVLSPELTVAILLVLLLASFYKGSPDARPTPRRRRPVLPLRRDQA